MSVAPPGKLDGWKAIATYLGRNERTAQRWAHERGMPVHHVPGGRSGAVFAWEPEINAWLQADRPLLTDAGAGEDGATPAPAPAALADLHTASNDVTAATHSVPRLTSSRLVGVGALLVAIVLAAVAATVLRREPPIVSQLQIAGATIEARDAQGRLAWRYDATGPDTPQQGSDGTVRARILQGWLADLDADGRPETLALVNYAHTAGRAGPMPNALEPHPVAGRATLGERLLCLTPRGALRWAFDPRHTLSFAGRRFDGPWRMYGWVAPIVSGRKRLWVSVIHDVWWPSFIVALDEGGASDVRYVSAGHVHALAHLDGGPTPLVLAGGVNNEYAAASLAALDAAGPPAASPQTASAGYYCDECPPGRPVRYILFPRSEVNRLSGDPYNRVEQIRVSGSQVMVTVFEGTFKVGARTVYGLSRTLDIESVGMSDSYWEAHRSFEREGRLNHSVEQCEEYTKGMAVRTWTLSTGWLTVWAKQAQRLAGSAPTSNGDSLRSHTSKRVTVANAVEAAPPSPRRRQTR